MSLDSPAVAGGQGGSHALLVPGAGGLVTLGAERYMRKKPLALPNTFEELVRAGGPDAYIREAARKAGDIEAGDWLRTLVAHRPKINDDNLEIIDAYIERLRRRLRVLTPSDRDRVRAMTRGRVRRFRARRAS